jgi:hypothetical protein
MPLTNDTVFPVIQSAWRDIESDVRSALVAGAPLEDLGVFVLDLRPSGINRTPARAEVMWRSELRVLANRFDVSFGQSLAGPPPPGCRWGGGL